MASRVGFPHHMTSDGFCTHDQIWFCTHCGTPRNPFRLHLHMSHCGTLPPHIQLHKLKRCAWRAFVGVQFQCQRSIPYPFKLPTFMSLVEILNLHTSQLCSFIAMTKFIFEKAPCRTSSQNQYTHDTHTHTHIWNNFSTFRLQENVTKSMTIEMLL